MFGYVVAARNRLSRESLERYSEFYCGLCRELGKYGLKSRAVLTYDMTFLLMLLGSVLGGTENEGLMRCPTAPLHKKKYRANDFTSYAADMNLLLAYCKFLDDRRDDKSVIAAAGALALKQSALKVCERYPEQSGIIKKELDELSGLEKLGENNPDLPANSFGRLMAGLFVFDKYSESAEKLAAFGHSLGRLIYIMDACVDFEKDLRHKKYNPMTLYTQSDFDGLLNMLAADCAGKYKALGCRRDIDIIENILYCGIWSVYRRRYAKEGSAGDTEPVQRSWCFGKRK